MTRHTEGLVTSSNGIVYHQDITVDDDGGFSMHFEFVTPVRWTLPTPELW